MANRNYRNTRSYVRHDNTFGHNYGERRDFHRSTHSYNTTKTGMPTNFDDIVNTVVYEVKKQLNQQNNLGQIPSQRRVYHNKHPENPADPEVKTLWKNLFRTVQIEYHKGNWSNTPKSIEKNFRSLGENITPPDPTPKVLDNIKDILSGACEAITNAIQTHLQERLEVHREAVKNTKCDNIKDAVDIAHRHLNSRLGHKIKNLREKLNSEAAHTGENAPVPPTTQQRPPAQQPLTVPEERGSTSIDTMPSSKRARLEPIRTPPPLSQITTPTAKTTIARKEQKKKIHKAIPFAINIRGDPQTIIVTDDSLMELDEADMSQSWYTWQLDVILKAEICDLGRIITQIHTDPSKRIVMAGGLNHKNGQYNASTDKFMADITKQIKDGRKIFCIGCSIDPNMKEHEIRNIESLNSKLETIFGTNYLHPVRDEDVALTEDKLKFNKRTCSQILLEINEMLFCLCED